MPVPIIEPVPLPIVIPVDDVRFPVVNAFCFPFHVDTLAVVGKTYPLAMLTAVPVPITAPVPLVVVNPVDDVKFPFTNVFSFPVTVSHVDFSPVVGI